MSGIIFGAYEPSKTPMERGADAIIGVFFDGTGNNRKNVRAFKAFKGEDIKMDAGENKQKYLDAYNKHADKNDGNNSYEADESNVSHLQLLYVVDKTKTFSVYIEGIGTESFKGDSGIGSALGTGDTGIIKRVENACETIAKKTLNGVVTEVEDTKGNMLIEKVIFDVYGFSRGAAAARHFVSQVKKKGSYNKYKDRNGETHIVDIPDFGYLGKALKKAKITINTIEIRFAGLYDTVSSYGIKHKNDHQQLSLNQLYHVKKTVHLIAQDEIRYNYDLINITSAGYKGLTISLPGVHSDIGGGYLENIKEEKVLLWDLSTNLDEALKKYNYFIAEGWYKTHEIEINEGRIRDEIIGRRKNITNKYSVLSLQLMGKLSDEYKAKIDIDALEDDFKTEGALLKEVEKRLDAQFLAKYTKKTTRIDLLKFDSVENEKELLAKKQIELREIASKWKIHLKSLNNKPIKPLYDSEKYNVKIDNTRVVQNIRMIVKDTVPTDTTDYSGLSDHQLLRALRNKFLHVSFDYTNATPTSWWQYIGVLYLITRYQEPMAPRENGQRVVYDDLKKY